MLVVVIFEAVKCQKRIDFIIAVTFHTVCFGQHTWKSLLNFINFSLEPMLCLKFLKGSSYVPKTNKKKARQTPTFRNTTCLNVN